jgi:5'-nucleotidase (lipoprotein e(P4) family)
MHRTIPMLTVMTVAFLFTMTGCKTTPASDQSIKQTKPISVGAQPSYERMTHENLNSILWMQTSPEYQITCQTMFNIARNALDKAIQDPKWTAALEQKGTYQSLPPAIILDIDDTVLDNSQFYGRLIKDNKGYDFNLWKEWVALSVAPPIPGAADFVFYAAGKGVEIFYITNRDAEMETDTRRNLSRLGVNLPIGEDTVLMNGEKPGWTSDKSSRRAAIAEKYRILLLIGDDMGDFIPGVKEPLDKRSKILAKYHSQWGRSWFLIPNPGSGSWEAALYAYNTTLSDTEILRKKFDAIRSFGGQAEKAVKIEPPTVIPDMTVTFSGNKCTLDGPAKVYPGKLTISLEIKEKGFPSYGLFLATFDQGKSMQDLVNWVSLDQPPWVHEVDAKIVTPGSAVMMSPVVSEGPLYLICFGFSPDTVIGRLGPVEVIK